VEIEISIFIAGSNELMKNLVSVLIIIAIQIIICGVARVED